MGCAECSRGGGGITDHPLGRKLSLAGEGVTPRTVLIDGQALATTPRKILVSIAIGQLRIAIETVYSTGHNPLGDGMALHAIRLLCAHLPQCHDGDMDTPVDHQDRLRHGVASVVRRAGVEHGHQPPRGRAV